MRLESRDFRAMLFLHFMEGKTAKESHEILSEVFSDQAPSYATAKNWFCNFRRGRESLEDDPRSGRPAEAVTPENVSAVKQMIQSDRRVTYSEIQAKLHIGSGSLHKIIHDYLGARKLVSRWIPHMLSEEQKEARVSWCHFMKQRFNSGTSRRTWDILTGDETWIYQFDPENKLQSTMWTFEGEEPPTKCRRSRSVGKVMVATFFMRSGHVATVPLQNRRTVNSEWYVRECLPKVFEAVTSKRPRTSTRGLLLHHDNASSHTAAQTLEFLHESSIQLVSHPPYSPDLAPCDFFLFPTCKTKLRGRRFETPESAVEAFLETIEELTKEEWSECFRRWFERMNSCIAAHGNYFEHL